MRRYVLAIGLLLTGCDAWPTVVDNQTAVPITIRYLQRDYDHWPAAFPVKPGIAIRLAGGHWIQDILGFEIKDREHIYRVPNEAIRRLERACPSNQLSRNVSFASDCFLIYHGEGRISVTAKEPNGIQFEQFGSGG